MCAYGGNLFAGVCINLPYNPGWGRSQETYGEESFHIGQMGAALVQPEAAAVTDGNLVTGRAPGAAIPFALALVERFCGAEARQRVAAELVWTE